MAETGIICLKSVAYINEYLNNVKTKDRSWNSWCENEYGSEHCKNGTIIFSFLCFVLSF